MGSQLSLKRVTLLASQIPLATCAMETTAVLFIFAFGISAIQAECPSKDSLPTCDAENKIALCARKWNGPGDMDTTKACNGCEGKDDYGDYYDGEEYKGVNVHTGSLIVNPGCTFTGWSGDNYDGNKQQFNAGLTQLVEATGTSDNDCAKPFRSIRCQCDDSVKCGTGNSSSRPAVGIILGLAQVILLITWSA